MAITPSAAIGREGERVDRVAKCQRPRVERQPAVEGGQPGQVDGLAQPLIGNPGDRHGSP